METAVAYYKDGVPYDDKDGNYYSLNGTPDGGFGGGGGKGSKGKFGSYS